MPAQPLAEVLRPQSLDEIFGQSHLLGQGKPLRIAYESGHLHNMIFWGPPGVGKTSLARLAAKYFQANFIELSAVFSGVKDIRQAVDEAKSSNQPTILFIDEIHRFNKSQQDALLPYTESGQLCLIGATTENPGFELNKALLSRLEVYVLKSLGSEDLQLLLDKTWPKIFPELGLNTLLSSELLALADGDARRLLNTLKQLENYVLQQSVNELNPEDVKRCFGQKIRRFDKQGDVFYEQISALHKSVRGSDPDAALYWLTSMIEAGVDMQYLSRRIIRIAWEDIGLADPKAMQIVNDAALTYERLGSPEGDLALASAIIYLAVAPKSNACYKAFAKAKAFSKNEGSREVPLHLRNASTLLAKNLAYGQGYRYAHDEPYGYAAGVSYWPDGLAPQTWYQPVPRGLEIKISEKLNFLRRLDQDNSSVKPIQI